MTHSFWTGGSDAYAEAIDQEYLPQIRELRKRREHADESELAKLDAEAQRLMAEYQSKRDSINDSLF